MDFSSIPILATALSLVICWAMFAVFCSLVHEAIVSAKAERGKFMRHYLFKQLYDQANGINWASLLYMHGSVDMLSRAENKPTNNIPSRMFAETLIDVVGSAQVVQMNAFKYEGYEYNNVLLRNFKIATEVMQPSDVMTFLKQAMNSAEVARTANGMPDEAVIYETLVRNIETWYGGFQERLSLWYKKQSRVRLFWLGTILAFIVNVDSLQLFTVFEQQPQSAKQVIAFYEANKPWLEATANRLKKEDSLRLSKGLDWRDSADSTQDSTRRIAVRVQQVVASADSLRQYVQATDSLIKAGNLPVGWHHNLFAELWNRKQQPAKDRSLLLLVICKLIGILLSGFAASMGAPFWFDLLKRTSARKQ